MLATVILSIIIFGFFVYVVYRSVQKRRSGGCNCSDCSCSPAPKSGKK